MANNFTLVCSHPRSLHNFRGDLIRKIKARGFNVTCLGPTPEKQDLEKIYEMGCVYQSYPVRRNGLNPLDDLKMLLSLIFYFYRNPAKKVMAYTIKPVIWSGIALFFFRGPKFTALITGLGFAFEGHGWKRKLLQGLVIRLYKLSLLRAEKVIFQNCDDMRFFISRKIVAESKCDLILGSGVDSKYFQYQTPNYKGALKFIMVARLLGEKGVRYYVDAARAINLLWPNVSFSLLGPTDSSPDGVRIDEVNAWVKEGVIEYLGETSDVRGFISDADVFVLPSFYGEGLPRTILEAMAIGRPILTTDNVGCRETVEQGVNGFLVPVRDASALAARMRWFIENPEQILLMGAASHKIMLQRFEIDLINKQYLRSLGFLDD